jgi:sodium/potassium-transporting ATPase subunit alpha
MVVTDCCVGTEPVSGDEARDLLISARNTDGGLAGNAIEQLQTVAGLCNAAEFDTATRRLPLAHRKIHGDATDQAILRFAEQLDSVAELKRCWQTRFEVAFNSKNKFMVRALGLLHPDGLDGAMGTAARAIFEPNDL